MRRQLFLFLEIIQGSLLHFWGLQAFEAALSPLRYLISRKGIAFALPPLPALSSAAAAEALGSGEAAGVRSAAPISSSCLLSLISCSSSGKTPGERARGQPGTAPSSPLVSPRAPPSGMWQRWIPGRWDFQLTPGAQNHLAQGQSSCFLGSLAWQTLSSPA